MRKFLVRFIPPALILLAVLVFLLCRERPAPVPKMTPSVPLSALAEKPDWSRLAAFQETITRADFEHLLETIFTTGPVWKNYIRLTDVAAEIDTGETGKSFILRFAPPGIVPQVPQRSWRSTAQLPPAPAGQPLHGIHIAIDPGHIGGEWAQIEARYLVVPGSPPVVEGDMTLLTAKLLKPRLEALGATVTLVRIKAEPVTPLRPDSLLAAARESGAADSSEDAVHKFAERLFYRTAEIRARAAVVNDTIKPDLVLCLHFNADGWGNPFNPQLVPGNHLHLLVNGAYTDDELRFADQRHAMLAKLLSGTFPEEAAIGADVAEVFAARTGMPPYQYPLQAANARPVHGNPYLWARNLLANRLYDCPVIFMEPYVMNSTVDHPRLAVGDYAGEREINGRVVPSIFREYADLLTEGLAKHYTETREITIGTQ
ncbi:MAG: hypothetical protein V4733_01885 [Verrucomicrobiota bacterium]